MLWSKYVLKESRLFSDIRKTFFKEFFNPVEHSLQKFVETKTHLK